VPHTPYYNHAHKGTRVIQFYKQQKNKLLIFLANKLSIKKNGSRTTIPIRTRSPKSKKQRRGIQPHPERPSQRSSRRPHNKRRRIPTPKTTKYRDGHQKQPQGQT